MCTDTVRTDISIPRPLSIVQTQLVWRYPAGIGCTRAQFFSRPVAKVATTVATGAKELNLAASDIRYLADAFIEWYGENSSSGLDAYSRQALARVWKAERFSWYLTGLTHRFPGVAPIERKLQIAELQYIGGSVAAKKVIAENYVGHPY